jgi:hypothetical protein
MASKFMKRLFICVIFICWLLISCQKTTNSEISFGEKLNDRKLTDSLYDRALQNGDTLAYLNLRAIYYIGGSRTKDFLYYSLMMSNKYNYKVAAGDVYFILTEGDSILDVKTQETADYYLLKSK